MALTAGTKLGPYEIETPLGAGGMGEVYRARDTRLERAVAIKVLPTHLSSNADAKQRFDREARAISSLNHPNICTLHDVGHQDGTDFLVMELLEGETLAQRLMRGALPADQVLRYGAEICDGLEKAHRSGIVHRDLKPGNIMLTKSGAKLLDFGLAKPPAPLNPISHSAAVGVTMTSPATPLTQQGSLVGTFQYMAPEQIEGKEADARGDIFALGAVLYEMTTGKRAFQGKSMLSVASAILEKEPDPISSIQPLTPPALDHLIGTCLAKDPEERFQTAHDVKLQLKWIGQGGSQTGVAKPVAVRRKRREWMAWVVAGALSLIMLAVGWWLHRPPLQPVLRSNLVLPETIRLDLLNTAVALSPDGRKVVLAATGEDGKKRLYLRSLDALTLQSLAETDDATYPFWSPDNAYIGFFTPGKLKKISVSSGAAQTICDAMDGRGGTWNADGTIVFAPAGDSGLFSVADSGGTPTQVTTPEKGGLSHRHPQFLPDGKHVLFYVAETSHTVGLFVLDLASKKTQFVVDSISRGEYVAPGYLLYVKERSLLAQPFDSSSFKLTGHAIPIAQQVQYGPLRWVSNFSAVSNGLLLYQAQEGSGEYQLTWFNVVDGKEDGKVGEPRNQANDLLSPDGKRAIVVVHGENGSGSSLWMYDVDRGVPSRFTFEDGAVDDPIWSPDGKQIAYDLSSSAGSKILLKNGDGTGTPKELLSAPASIAPTAWSPDGKSLIYGALNTKNKKFEIWVLPLNGDKPYVFLQGEASFQGGSFSPDGRWLVYQSNETGRDEIYVTPFPGPGGKRQVSSQGGLFGLWYGKKGATKQGIVYGDPNSVLLYLVPATEKNGALEFGQPVPMFGGRTFTGANGGSFSPDGKRMLISVSTASSNTGSLVLVNNWQGDLGK